MLWRKRLRWPFRSVAQCKNFAYASVTSPFEHNCEFFNGYNMTGNYMVWGMDTFSVPVTNTRFRIQNYFHVAINYGCLLQYTYPEVIYFGMRYIE